MPRSTTSARAVASCLSSTIFSTVAAYGAIITQTSTTRVAVVAITIVITTIHMSGWILSRKLGIMMMILYFMFLALSLLLEFDVILGPCENTVSTTTTVAGR